MGFKCCRRWPLKKEFDTYRKDQKPHPIMVKHNLNFVPYQHKNLIPGEIL